MRSTDSNGLILDRFKPKKKTGKATCDEMGEKR